MLRNCPAYTFHIGTFIFRTTMLNDQEISYKSLIVAHYPINCSNRQLMSLLFYRKLELGVTHLPIRPLWFEFYCQGTTSRRIFRSVHYIYSFWSLSFITCLHGTLISIYMVDFARMNSTSLKSTFLSVINSKNFTIRIGILKQMYHFHY